MITSVKFRGSSYQAGLALLLLAACGGSQAPGSSSEPAAPATAAPAATTAPPADSSATGNAGQTADTTPPEPTAPPEPPPPPAPTGPPLAEGSTVLIIGDSFANSLGLGLKRKQDELGVKFIMKGEKATYIPEWASSKDVPGLLRYWKPDLVIISLGGNELELQDPSIRASRVQKLVGHMGETPCVWVAPALWGNEETGLLKVIEDNVGVCKHYDSNELAPNLPRGADKIHPDHEGQNLWAEALLSWIAEHRDHTAEGFAWKD